MFLRVIFQGMERIMRKEGGAVPGARYKLTVVRKRGELAYPQQNPTARL